MSDEPLSAIRVSGGSQDELIAARAILEACDPESVQNLAGGLRGRASPEAIARLRALGLTVQIEAPAPGGREDPPPTGVAAPRQPGAEPWLLQRRSKRTDPELQQRFVRLERSAPRRRSVTPAAGWYRVTLDVPFSRAIRDRLAAIGVEVSSYRRGQYQVYLRPEQRAPLADLPFVQEVRPYDLLDSVSTDLLVALHESDQAAAAPPPATRATRAARAAPGTGATTADVPSLDTFDATVHRPADLPALQALLEQEPAVHVLETSATVVRFEAPRDDALLARVAALCYRLAPFRRPSLCCDRGRDLLGLDQVGLGPGAGAGTWTGRGEIVGVLDSGIDDAHPDFGGAAGQPASRIQDAVGFRGCKTRDGVGHGTHVAGIIAGTGAASAGKVRGMAPDARLVIVGMVRADFTLELPIDLGELLGEAVTRGATIVNCSWARALGSTYDSVAASLDRFVRANPGVLVVVAAGNEGTAPAPDGIMRFFRIGTPATAKNVVTVGACGTDRTGFTRRWVDFDPAQFQPPEGDGLLAPGADRTAALSSTGPTDYEGVKPDLIAPGTYVLAPRSSTLLGSLKWEPCGDFGGRYVFMHGTSMAAPMVSGAAAVLRQYLREQLGLAAPSAALLKAILINAGARLPERPRPGAPAIGYPDFDHGFGRLDLAAILPRAGAPPDRAIVFDDVPNDSPEALESGLAPGAIGFGFRRYRFVVSGSQDPLRLTLTWTDPPGDDVQNQLQVSLALPDGTQRRGNDEHRYGPPALPGFAGASGRVNLHNTVQHVRIEAPPAGAYEVRVWAWNTVVPPQGYALAVCGQLAFGLSRTSP